MLFRSYCVLRIFSHSENGKFLQLMNREFNIKFIFKVLGSLLIVEGLFLILAIPVDLYYREHTTFDFLISAAIAFSLGITGIILEEMLHQQ